MKDTMKTLQEKTRNMKGTIKQAMTELINAMKETITDSIKNLAQQQTHIDQDKATTLYTHTTLA